MIYFILKKKGHLTFLLTLHLFAHTVNAQIGYRTATHDVTITTSYDGSYDFDKIDCNIEPVLLVGQELYFPLRNGTKPYDPNDKSFVEDHWFDNMISDAAVPFASLLSDEQSERLSDPIRSAGWRIIDPTLSSPFQTYSKNKDYATHIYKPRITEYPRTLSFQIRTPYSALENKTFKILACSDSAIPGTFRGTCYFSFTLQDENKETFHFGIHSARIADYPFYFKSRLEQLKKDHVGKKYYAKWGNASYLNPLNNHLYNNDPEKEYTCTEFTFIRTMYGERTKPYFILKDASGNEIAVSTESQEKSTTNMRSIEDFWDEQGYTDFKIRRQKTYDSLVAAWEEAQRELIEEQKQLEKEKNLEKRKAEKARADRVNSLIAKYGKKAGMMVAVGKVELGMTREMCEDAWGDPVNTTKSDESGRLMETWRYSYSRWLRFTDGKLTAVTQ